MQNLLLFSSDDTTMWSNVKGFVAFFKQCKYFMGLAIPEWELSISSVRTEKIWELFGDTS
jgi:hypothetical protein